MVVVSWDFNMIESLADSIGATENSLRLLVSLFLGYPLALFHRYFLYGSSETLQNIYFTLSGLGICYFNFGGDTIHSAINILLIYAVLKIFGGSSMAATLALSINMGYLLVGYYINATDGYDVKWTTPHCVLVLRLIGVVFDVVDGRSKPEQLTAERKETALTTVPSLLEMCGHTYFFGSFLVGPQFSMRRYQDFLRGAFVDRVTGGKPRCVMPGFARLSMGIMFTCVYQISSLYLDDEYLTSSDFQETSLFWRLIFILVWGKMKLYKYVACWLITEGACIMTGLTYNGQDENGNELWDGAANIKVRHFEMSSSARDLVASFNINTNRWMAKYVFKRLRWMGNKNASHLFTMMFLAIWHGLHIGYFICFFTEFLMVFFETAVSNIVGGMPTLSSALESPAIAPFMVVFKKLYCQMSLSYALVPFCLLTFSRTMLVYSSTFFFAQILFLSVIFVDNFLLLPRRRAKQRRDREAAAKATKAE